MINNKKIQNYLNIKKFQELILSSDNIILFVHVNSLSQFEINNNLDSLLKSKGIFKRQFNWCVLNKFINVQFIKPLLVNTCNIISTNNYSNLNYFLKNVYFKNNCIPLTFLINREFYNYNYIMQLMKLNKNLNADFIYSKFNNFLTNPIQLFLSNLLHFFKKLLLTLKR